MSAHTPGPWDVGERAGLIGDELTVENVDGIVICACWQVGEDFDGENDDANMRANARLIAAAPMMAEALRGIVEARDASSTGAAFMVRAESYIAAARDALRAAGVVE